MLELQGISKSFTLKSQFMKAERNALVLRDVDLTIHDNEIVTIVGESGCGKTTIGRIITGLLEPTNGKILFDGKIINAVQMKNNSEYRRSIQFIQQDSYAALNPVKTIRQSIAAAIRTFNPQITEDQLDIKIRELINNVGLPSDEQFINKYPHQLSGGQRQRILLARALSLEPKLIVADEPVSMIDVSMRVSILNLIARLNKEFHIAFVYITHDLATAKYVTENGRICVMYLGDIVELGETNKVLFHPKHPYTQALISAVPVPDPEIAQNQKPIQINGMEITNLEKRGAGCSFANRCPFVSERCTAGKIPMQTIDGVQVRCINTSEVPIWEN